MQYPVFEADQVLTAKNLNDVVSHLTRQDLQTRRELIGIGVVCGLEVTGSLSANVKISKGVGVTSMGCLISMPACTLKYYKKYIHPETSAAYKPFQKPNSTYYDFWEMFNEKEFQEMDDASVAPLSGFKVVNMKELAVVLYLEIIDKDLEKCIGEDCDEKGIARIHTIRRLLVKKSDLLKIVQSQSGKLNKLNFGKIDGLYDRKVAVSGLPLPVLHRLNHNLADLTSLNLGQINSWPKLFDSFHGVIQKGSLKIGDALWKSFEHYKHILAGQYPSGNPFSGFNNTTSTSNSLYQLIKLQIDKDKYLVQYAYDFLEDLLHAYYEFWNASFRYLAVCCPDTDLFPQHLMLGCLYKKDSDIELFRHHWIPSPAVAGTDGLAEKLRILHLKLVFMIKNFRLIRYNSTSQIKITPSHLKGEPSSKRSIGHYYAYNINSPINKVWNYELYRSNKEDHILSYFANAYSSIPYAINPLLYDIKPFDMFRIEGHIGQDLNSVKNKIQQQIEDYNLPLDLISIKLSTDHLDVEVDDACFQDIQTVYKCNRDEFLSCLNGLTVLIEAFLKLFAMIAKNYPALLKQPINQKKAGFSFINTWGDLYLVLQIYVFFLRKIQVQLPENIKDFNYPIFRISYFSVYAFTLFGQIFLEILSNFVTQFSAGGLQIMVIKTLFERIIDDCMDGKFKSLYDMYRDRLLRTQMGRLFPGFVGGRTGMEHMAGSPEGGTFVLVYDEIPEEKPETPDRRPEKPKEEEDPCFKEENAENIQLNILHYAYYATREPMIMDEIDMNFDIGPFGEMNMYESAEVRGGATAKEEKERKEEKLNENRAEAIKIEQQTPAEFLEFVFGKNQKPEEVERKNYRVVADFAVPYRCCSSCLQVEELPKKEVTIDINPTEFCIHDKKKYPFILEPADGTITSNSGGIVEDDAEYYFQPTSVGGSKEEVTVTYDVDGTSSSIVLKVYNPIASFDEHTFEDDNGNISTILESTSQNHEKLLWKIEETGRTSTGEKLTIEHNKFTQETLKISLTASKGKCDNAATTILKLSKDEPAEVIIRLPRRVYCANDKNAYPITVIPSGGALTPREMFTETADGPVFIPSNVTPGDIKFTYTFEGKAADFTVKVIKVTAAFTVQEQSKEIIRLKNSSVNAENIEWFVEGVSMGSEEELQIKTAAFDEKVIKVTLVAVALDGECRDAFSQDFTLEQELEVSLDLQKPKGMNSHTYCNNDRAIYRFLTIPAGGAVKGSGVIEQNGIFFFQPLGIKAGTVTFNYLSASLKAKVLKAQEISYEEKLMKYDKEKNIGFVQFNFVGEIENQIVWNFDDDKDIVETNEKEVTREFDFNAKDSYHVSVGLINKNGCLSEFSKDIDLKTLLSEDAGNDGTRIDPGDFGRINLGSISRTPTNLAIATSYGHTANEELLKFNNETRVEISSNANALNSLRKGAKNTELSERYNTAFDKTVSNALEAHQKRDVKATSYFVSSYIGQIQSLLAYITELNKDIPKSSSLYKTMLAVGSSLEAMKVKGIEINPQGSLDVLVEKSLGLLKKKPNILALVASWAEIAE